ncbi:PucR family transcriptional regulator [Microbacterium sp. bgisy189]|uniref:PucR family transcriptional regulator n=1 Tax=Microbacterium sp. bgisy189 TaxID=3413798 RepID=UPI003EBBFE59
MAERREEPSIHTDRPGTHESSPTVREIIGLDAVVAGHPQLLAGESGLDARVRWVHVSDSAGVARLLDGGELLLSTGSGWPEQPDELRAFVDGLVTAGLACLVVELGTHYRYMPAVLIDAARAGGLPLVALHREVKFVTITEAVHRRIIAEQTAALRARDDVRARFTALALRGSPADFIVHQLAQTLGAAVVLENLAHEVVVADVAPSVEEEVLTRWEVRSRIAHRDGAASAEDWLIVPVEARGIRWGYLVALPGPPHPAGRAGVLEQGAIALALGRLTDTDGDEWALIGRRRLLDELLAGRWSTAGGATARVEAAGMPVDSAQLYGLVASGVDVRPETADVAAAELGGRALTAGGPNTAILLSLPARVPFDDATARRFASALTPVADRLVLSIGAAGVGLEAGLRSVQEAADLARAVRPVAARGPHIRRVDERPLARLVSALRDDHRVLQHGERMLAPLIEYDMTRHGDLLDVLGAMLSHPGNRTAAASASHLSRSVFYQRIALIQELLDADLDDGEVQAALHLALLVRRSSAR